MKKYILTMIALGIVAILNSHLWGGPFPSHYLFYGSEGSWLNMLSYAWIHVSWYHLLIDCGAFLLLLYSLQTHSAARKVGYIIACMSGSALFAQLQPETSLIGLCGLSGTAHGISAICAMECLQDKDTRRMGIVLLVLFSAKCAYEIITGSMLFAEWHLGNIGRPLGYGHAGGVITGITAYYLINLPVISKKEALLC